MKKKQISYLKIKEKIEHLLPISQNLSVITRKWRRCPPLLPCYVNEVSPPDMSSQVSDTLIVVQFWLNKELTVIWQHNYQMILLKSQLLSKAIIINQQILCNLSLLKSTPPNFQYGWLSKNKFSLHISILFSFRYVFVTYGPWSGDIKFSDSINRPRCILVIANKFSSPAERFFHLPLKDFFISRWKIAETGGKTGNASLLEKITDRQGKVKAKCGIAWMHNMQNVQCTDTG